MKCELCQSELPAEKCIFAQYRRVINGEEHVFCCSACANNFEEKKGKGKGKGKGKKRSKK